MQKYLVQPEWYDAEEIEDARTTMATSPHEAAEEFVRMNHANLDYPEEVEVLVQDPKGVRTTWNVFVQIEPTFRAIETKQVSG